MSGTLAARLEMLRADLKKKMPAEVWAMLHEHTEQLRRSGIADGVIKIGDRLPDFALNNAAGELVASKDLLAKGAVVLTVFRGSW